MTKPKGHMVLRRPGAVPVPVNRDIGLSQIAERSLEEIALDEYDGDDPAYAGKTRLEAALLSLARSSSLDPAARAEFLDRVMGKPRQRSENVNVNVDLHSFLSRLADEDNVIEAVPVSPEGENGRDSFS